MEDLTTTLKNAAEAVSNGTMWRERVEPFAGNWGDEYITPAEYINMWAAERADALRDMPLWDVYRQATNAVNKWLSRKAQWLAQRASEPALRAVQGTPGIEYVEDTHALVRKAGRKAEALAKKRRNLNLAGPVKDVTNTRGEIVEASEFWADCFIWLAEHGIPAVADERKAINKMASYAVDQKERAEAETPQRNEKGGRIRIMPQAIDAVIEALAVAA
jgi:hypothetical protein